MNEESATQSDAPEQMRQAIQDFSIKDFGKSLLHRFQNDNATGLASQVAYNTVFAIPPLLILLVTIAAIVNSTTGIAVTETLHRAIANHAPGSTKPLLDQLVTNAIDNASAGAVSIGAAIALVLTLWGASGGLGSLIDAFNGAYEVKDSRNFIRKRALIIGLTVATGLFVIAAVVLPLFAHRIGGWVADAVGLGSIFTTAWSAGSWVIAFIFIAFVLALLYYFGPDVQVSWQWVSPGSLVASLLWLVAIVGFRVYLMFSNPGNGYGAAGSVLVLLFFLWLSALIFILGAEINAVLASRYDVRTIRDLVRHPDKTNPERHRMAEQRAREVGIADTWQAPQQAGVRSAATSWPRAAVGERPSAYSAMDENASKRAAVIAFAGLIGGVVLAALLGKKEQEG